MNRHAMRVLLVVQGVLALGSGAVWAQAKGAAAGGAAAKAAVAKPNERQTLRKTVEAYPLHGKFALSHLVRCTVVDGLLAVEVTRDVPDVEHAMRVEVEGSKGTWVVHRRLRGRANAYTTFAWYDFEAAEDRVWSSSMTIRDNYLALASQVGDSTNGLRIRLTQSGRSLRFTVSQVENRRSRTVVSATATSVRELVTENPQAVRQYLDPAVRKITGRSLFKPGPADVYRVFDQINPDPEAAQKVISLLGKLESDSFKEREQASAALAEMGAPAVLAVLRLDESLHSAEVRVRLDSFVASQSGAMFGTIAEARQDPHFLIDCLEDEDPKVRRAAKEALEKVAGRAVEFDDSLTGEARAQALERLRGELAGKDK